MVEFQTTLQRYSMQMMESLKLAAAENSGIVDMNDWFQRFSFDVLNRYLQCLQLGCRRSHVWIRFRRTSITRRKATSLHPSRSTVNSCDWVLFVHTLACKGHAQLAPNKGSKGVSPCPLEGPHVLFALAELSLSAKRWISWKTSISIIPLPIEPSSPNFWKQMILRRGNHLIPQSCNRSGVTLCTFICGHL